MKKIENCNVCVVGGAGFLGSHLVNHLIDDRNCRVTVIDNLVAGRREFVHARAEFIHHDITGSEDRLRQIFTSAKTQYVLNYAAYPYIPVSFSRPLHVCDVNFMGAIKVINAAQEAGADGILQVSSAEIYGDHPNDTGRSNETMQISETDPVNPHSSYGVAKAAVDSFVQVAWRERKTPCIALRQFNCLGERETHPYIVPEIIGQISRRSLTGMPCQVSLGNNSFRDFLYAGDAVKIAVWLLERGQFGEVYNLGSETGIKMYDLAKLIGKIMGFADVIVKRDETRVRPWEIWHLQSDNTKIWDVVMPSHKNVGVSKSQDGSGRAAVLTSLEEALRKTVRWFNENGRKWPWEK